MARRIWKFDLRGGEENNFFAEIPAEGRVLSTGWQHGRFVVWAMVETTHPLRMHRFHVSGTNHDLAAGARVDNLIGRIEVITPDGTMIFHVFDLGE